MEAETTVSVVELYIGFGLIGAFAIFILACCGCFNWTENFVSSIKKVCTAVWTDTRRNW